ncbi:tetrahydrofolate dehydrogenase/cyclohydrolase catalytic domain-containing protein [Microbispora sp. ATCC PTA-5024]|uniref:tetrahydrofolate dehydrogenase/cyclohydrolase catalytic domain-containing protein n=1 Tax=Microbispora sp. ATCC PTA-5024 TaxID=316330 RepID=UPI0009FC7C42|nr:tetrahydrofolate dehydrogenase/cyclohydrolase catalytic domain-containing protein [Microbispora sp. ATCC PTA-5024]
MTKNATAAAVPRNNTPIKDETRLSWEKLACGRVGIDSRYVRMPATTTTAELIDSIGSLSEDPDVHGILLQHPVGEHIDERAAFEAIAPGKDVDGVTMHSFAAMSFGLPGFVSCTPGGIMRLLDDYDVDVAGKHPVVVGRSAILGRPAGMLLLGRELMVTKPRRPRRGPSGTSGGRRPASCREW